MPIINKQSGLTQARHRVHRPHGLLACMLCGWESTVVYSYPVDGDSHKYYVTCEHCRDVDDGGCFDGPIRNSVREASEAFNKRMNAYALSIRMNMGGRYDLAERILTGHR